MNYKEGEIMSKEKVYIAYFDAGYYPDKNEYILAYTIEKDDVICDFEIKIAPFHILGLNASALSKYIETFALRFLLEKINQNYNGCLFYIYGDCRDIIKNVIYGNGCDEHRNIGDIVDSFRYLYDQKLIRLSWIPSGENMVVDYLTQYSKIYDKLEYRKVILSQDYKNPITLEAKLIYDGKFYKRDNTNYQINLFEDLSGILYLSVRYGGHRSDYVIINTKDDINSWIDVFSENCREIKFNHKIFNNGDLFKYINNTYLKLK